MLFRRFLCLSLFLLSGCTQVPEGNARPFVYFHGKNYLEIKNSESINLINTEDFTLEGWFSYEKSGQEELSCLFMISNDKGENTLGLYCDPEFDNNWAFFLGDRLVGVVETDFSASDDEIHFVAFSCNRQDSSWVLYLDTRAVFSGNLDTDLDFQNSDILLGADFDSPNTDVGNLWTGRLYEWRLWKYSLTPTEELFTCSHPDKITVHYTPGWQTDLLALWRMALTESGDIIDESNNANTAFLKEIP